MSQAGTYDISAVVVPILTISGDIGGAVGPTAGNVDLLGGNNITVTGTPLTSTLTIDLTGTTQYAVQVGNATGSLSSLVVGTDGQLLIGAAGADPAFATVTSADGTIVFVTGPNTLDFNTSESVHVGTGYLTSTPTPPTFDDTVPGQFTLLAPGSGYITGELVTWTAPQTVMGLVSGSSYYIYIDNTGTLQSSPLFQPSIYRDNIVLFVCYRDATLPTNNQFTILENHTFNNNNESVYWEHTTIGPLLRSGTDPYGRLLGPEIEKSGTQKIKITWAGDLVDFDLQWLVAAGVTPVVWYHYFNDAGGWARYTVSDTFDGSWNNAGTVTALGAGKYSINILFATPANVEVAGFTPCNYWTIMGEFQYDSLSAARTAIADNSFITGFGLLFNLSLSKLHLCQLGYLIYEQSSNSIVEVISEPQNSQSSVDKGFVNTAALTLSEVTNYNHILGATDTNVQAALDTIDDLTLRADGPTDSQAAAGVFTIAGGTAITTTAAGSTVTVDLDSPLAVAYGGTGAATLTDHSVLVGSGVAAITPIAVGATGELLVGTTGADPAFGTSASGDFTFTTATAAATRTLAVSNTDATGASYSAAQFALTTQAGSTGDPFIRFNVNGGQDYALGIDNSDADALKIQDDANPSTGNTLWKMTSAGERTMPLQPAFLGYLAASKLNKTGNGTTYIFGADALTEAFDQNNDFNTNGTFTAPITGKYYLKFCVTISNATAAAANAIANIITTGYTIRNTIVAPGPIIITGGYCSFEVSAVVDMTAADTAYCNIKISGEAGDTVHIYGAGDLFSYFCGYLVC